MCLYSSILSMSRLYDSWRKHLNVSILRYYSKLGDKSTKADFKLQKVVDDDEISNQWLLIIQPKNCLKRFEEELCLQIKPEIWNKSVAGHKYLKQKLEVNPITKMRKLLEELGSLMNNMLNKRSSNFFGRG